MKAFAGKMTLMLSLVVREKGWVRWLHSLCSNESIVVTNLPYRAADVSGDNLQRHVAGPHGLIGVSHFSQNDREVQPRLVIAWIDRETLSNVVDGIGASIEFESDQAEVMQARSVSRRLCQHATVREIGFVQLARLQVLHGIAKVASEHGIDGRQRLGTGIG